MFRAVSLFLFLLVFVTKVGDIAARSNTNSAKAGCFPTKRRFSLTKIILLYYILKRNFLSIVVQLKLYSYETSICIFPVIVLFLRYREPTGAI
jgi:hypothetical protein